MSICRNRNPDLEEEEPVKQVNVRAPSNMTTGSNASHPSIMRRTKKNKTRIPKNVMFNLEEEEILYPNKGKEKTLIHFEQFSDDRIDSDRFEDKINNSDLKDEDEKENQKEKKVEQKVEIINTDIPVDSSKKEEKENESKTSELLQDKIIDKKDSLTEEKIDNVEEKKEEEENIIKINDNNDDSNKDDQREENNINNDNNKGNEVKEENVEKEVEEIKNDKNEEEKKEVNIVEEKEKEKEEENKINEEHAEKEEENKINEEHAEKEEENKINEEHVEKEQEDNKVEEVNVKVEEETVNQEKEENENNTNLLRSKNNINEEEKEEKGKEDVKKDDEKEEEEDNEKEKNSETKESEDEFNKKYESLINLININLQAKGFEKFNIKLNIDEVYKSFNESSTPEDKVSKLSELLINMMEVTLDSDKKEIQDFFTELVTLYNGDIIKIYEQLREYFEKIVEQEKLTTKRLNRTLRSYIQDAKEKLNIRLKNEDIPSDKIISYELFKEIVEECEIKLKENYMDILLYQMKIAVPQGRSFNSLNAIVIIDFLK